MCFDSRLFRCLFAALCSILLAALVGRARPAGASVELTDFRAEIDDGIVIIIWETQSELDNLGFNVYRSERETAIFSQLAEEERIRINPLIIGSQGGLTENEYRLEDANVVEEVTYYYWLEDVELSGGLSHHGPLRVELTADAPVGPPPTGTPTAIAPTSTSPAPTPTNTPSADVTATPRPTAQPTATADVTATLPPPTSTLAPPSTAAPTQTPTTSASPSAPPTAIPSPPGENSGNGGAAPAPTATEVGEAEPVAGAPDAGTAATPDVIGGTSPVTLTPNITLTPSPEDTDTSRGTPTGLLVAIGTLAGLSLITGVGAIVYILRRER